MYKYLIVAITLLIITGCKKHTDSKNPYVGTWELRVSSGFNGPENHRPGNGHVVMFTSEKFKRIIDSENRYEVSYTLSRDTNFAAYPPQVMDLLTGLNTSFFIEVKSDTLSMYYSEPITEGGYSAYVRIR